MFVTPRTFLPSLKVCNICVLETREEGTLVQYVMYICMYCMYVYVCICIYIYIYIYI